MKTINTYISEKLKIPVKKINGKPTIILSLFPRNEDELREIIEQEIEENGNECSLNHIDTSKITSMQKLFYNSRFNGDISKWDVSNVTDMNCMFYNSYFNGDISGWDVSNVTDMHSMFDSSNFNGDISGWNVSNVIDMNWMFARCKTFNYDISNWRINKKCTMDSTFLACSLDEKYRPTK